MFLRWHAHVAKFRTVLSDLGTPFENFWFESWSFLALLLATHVHRHRDVVRTCHACFKQDSRRCVLQPTGQEVIDENSQFQTVLSNRLDVGSECRSQLWRAVTTHDEHGHHQRIIQSFTRRYSGPLHRIVHSRNRSLKASAAQFVSSGAMRSDSTLACRPGNRTLATASTKLPLHCAFQQSSTC